MKEIQKEFSESIRNGNGYAYILLKKYPDYNFDKYIYKACLRFLAYEPQLEDLRGEYLYKFIKLSKNESELEHRILISFIKYYRSDWNLLQLFDLVKTISINGNKHARKIIYKKFDSISNDKYYYDMLDLYANVIIEFDKEDGLIYIAKSFGDILKKDFEFKLSFYSLELERVPNYIKLLEKEKNEKINIFLNEIKKMKTDEKVSFKSYKNYFETAKLYIEGEHNFPLVAIKSLNEEELKFFAVRLSNVKHDTMIEKILRIFTFHKFPLDAKIVLDLIDNRNEKIVENSYQVLSNISDTRVRELFEKKEMRIKTF